jgi:hypothetical protein
MNQTEVTNFSVTADAAQTVSQHVLSSIVFHACSLHLGSYMNHIADA